MIGTNNTGHRPAVQETPQDTADGIKAILELIARNHRPPRCCCLASSRVVPDRPTQRAYATVRSTTSSRRMPTVRALPTWISAADAGVGRYAFSEMMPDLLHPKEKGYGIWARAVLPVIKETLEMTRDTRYKRADG